jgi:hypothetical protein
MILVINYLIIYFNDIYNHDNTKREGIKKVGFD